MQVNFHFIEFTMTNGPPYAAVLLGDSGCSRGHRFNVGAGLGAAIAFYSLLTSHQSLRFVNVGAAAPRNSGEHTACP